MDQMPSRAARTAYLVLTVIFWITVVVGMIVVAHRLFGLLQDSQTLTVPASVAVDDVRLPEAFEIAGPLPVNVDIADPSLTQRVIATVPIFVWWTLALVGLWLLRKVARSAAKGDPFQESNVRRLRWLGVLFLLGFPLATIDRGVLQRPALLRRRMDGWTAPARRDRHGIPGRGLRPGDHGGRLPVRARRGVRVRRPAA